MKLKFVVLFFLVFVSLITLKAQNKKHFIYGYVFDKQTKEVLVGCSVINLETGEGTSTDGNGFYKIWLSDNADSVNLRAQFLSYAISNQKTSTKVEKINWYLEKQDFSVDEVVVSAKKQSNFKQDISNFSINTQELKALPSLLGENDVLKYFQLTPGVQKTNDFNSQLFVRGGSHDQNLYIIDGIPIYHVSHVAGFLSTFNSDIINSTDLYKGSFPARFGGRLSSVLDMKTLDGDKNKTNYNLTLGLISSKIFINGPLKKDKSSYLISLRKNTLPYLKLVGENDLGYLFYDINIKFNTKLKDNSNLSFVFYSGGDGMSYKVKEDESFKTTLRINWGNVATSLNYNKKLTSRLFLESSGGISTFKYKEHIIQKMYEEDKLFSDIESKFNSNANNLFLNTKTAFFMSEKLELVVGIDYSYQIFNPGAVEINKLLNGASSSFSAAYLKQKTLLLSPYAEFVVNDFYGFILNLGVRTNYYSIEKETSFLYEPRINLTKKMGSNFKIEAAYSEVNQYVLLLINNSGGISLDYRFAANSQVKPSHSKQWVGGFSYISEYSDYEISLSAYYKSLSNLVRMKEGVNFTNNFSSIETLIYQNGTGKSKGIEFLFRKNTGNSSGWISATLSQTNRLFEGINNNKPFPFLYDRLLDVSLLFQQKITKDLQISFTWSLATGAPYTLPSAQYTDIDGNTVYI